MRTYRCPYCGAKEFSVQDLEVAEQEQSNIAIAVRVECTACHWVGPISELGGKH